MEIQSALKNQHIAALTMFRQLVADCPEDLWLEGPHPRSFWRIAFHALAYAHLYLYENLDSWKPWSRHRKACTWLEGDAPEMTPYTREETLELIDLPLAEVEPRIDSLNLSDPECGFAWYPAVSRVELLILSLRHLQGHLGQLNELMIARGLDVEWLGQRP